MELDFSDSSCADGILSFSRGIQLLKPAFKCIKRNQTYQLFICLKSRTMRLDTTVELLEYNEYYLASKISPWQKVCGYCQKSKVTKRCSGSKKTYYCNEQCQREHWKYT